MIRILFVLPALTFVWSIGLIIWTLHLSRKFDRYSAVANSSIAHCEEIRERYGSDWKADWDVEMARAELNVAAEELVLNDLMKAPFWFYKLRGRWNADYLSEVVQ